MLTKKIIDVRNVQQELFRIQALHNVEIVQVVHILEQVQGIVFHAHQEQDLLKKALLVKNAQQENFLVQVHQFVMIVL